MVLFTTKKKIIYLPTTSCLMCRVLSASVQTQLASDAWEGLVGGLYTKPGFYSIPSTWSSSGRTTIILVVVSKEARLSSLPCPDLPIHTKISIKSNLIILSFYDDLSTGMWPIRLRHMACSYAKTRRKPKVLFADPGIPDITKMGPSIALNTNLVCWLFYNNTLSK